MFLLHCVQRRLLMPSRWCGRPLVYATFQEIQPVLGSGPARPQGGPQNCKTHYYSHGFTQAIQAGVGGEVFARGRHQEAAKSLKHRPRGQSGPCCKVIAKLSASKKETKRERPAKGQSQACCKTAGMSTCHATTFPPQNLANPCPNALWEHGFANPNFSFDE